MKTTLIISELFYNMDEQVGWVPDERATIYLYVILETCFIRSYKLNKVLDSLYLAVLKTEDDSK